MQLISKEWPKSLKIRGMPGKRELLNGHQKYESIQVRRFLALMTRKSFQAFLLLASVATAWAGDLRITLPKRSKPTPVQQLNRDGVKAIEKHRYSEAKKLFYKAYLLDPNDPFTLNNLGYISELDGEIERAQRYYALAGELSSDATIA